MRLHGLFVGGAGRSGSACVINTIGQKELFLLCCYGSLESNEKEVNSIKNENLQEKDERARRKKRAESWRECVQQKTPGWWQQIRKTRDTIAVGSSLHMSSPLARP